MEAFLVVVADMRDEEVFHLGDVELIGVAQEVMHLTR